MFGSGRPSSTGWAMPQTQSSQRQPLVWSPCPQAGGEAGPSAASEAAEILPRKTLPVWCEQCSLTRACGIPPNPIDLGALLCLTLLPGLSGGPSSGLLPLCSLPLAASPGLGVSSGPAPLPPVFWGQTIPVLPRCLSPACRAECQLLPDVKWQI